MVTHSGILAWKIPWTEEPGRLLYMGLQRVRHDWSNFAFTSILLLGNYSTDKLTPVCIGIYGKFSTALFSVRGKDCDQPKYLSKGKYVNKLRHIYKMKYHAALKMNKIDLFGLKWKKKIAEI